ADEEVEEVLGVLRAVEVEVGGAAVGAVPAEEALDEGEEVAGVEDSVAGHVAGAGLGGEEDVGLKGDDAGVAPYDVAEGGRVDLGDLLGGEVGVVEVEHAVAVAQAPELVAEDDGDGRPDAGAGDVI